jgi:MscS family membrane protein
MIGGIAAMVIIDILELSGLGIRSAFALGSAGTLAITLGTQSLVSHIVSGFTMTTSNRFYVGDFVKFGSASGGGSFSGTVMKLGWLETTIRGGDELIHTIPNAKLEGIAVSNLSRHERCQFKTTLRFHYKDIHKLEALLQAMKDEIINATSENIVTDGSRPCRVVFSDYKERWLEVLVDVHFQGIKPIGDKYWKNRQKVLYAIQKAVDSHGIEFAVLQSSCECCVSSSSKK